MMNNISAKFRESIPTKTPIMQNLVGKSSFGGLQEFFRLKGLTHGEEVSGDFLAGADPNELAMTCKTYSNIIALFFNSSNHTILF